MRSNTGNDVTRRPFMISCTSDCLFGHPGDLPLAVPLTLQKPVHRTDVPLLQRHLHIVLLPERRLDNHRQPPARRRGALTGRTPRARRRSAAAKDARCI
jgi:hypothetical protein